MAERGPWTENETKLASNNTRETVCENGKRRAEGFAKGSVDIDVMGGYAAVNNESTKRKCKLQLQDEWVRSTIRARGRGRLLDLPRIRDLAVYHGNRGLFFNIGLRPGDLVIVMEPHKNTFAHNARYRVVVTKKGNKITTEDYKGQRKTTEISQVTQLKGFRGLLLPVIPRENKNMF